MKEDALIKKFYNEQSSEKNNGEIIESSNTETIISNDEEIKK